MADRFPLVVNEISRKIEELVSGDSLDLTGSGISIGGNTGINGQYLRTDGSTVLWDSPGDVFLTATQTLTNKTLVSPILITPNLGVATATRINGLTISTINSGTLSIGDSKTVAISNTLSFSGTDSSVIQFGTGGTVLYDGAVNFTNLTESTSAELRAKISDETGTGLLVFNTSPQISTSITSNSTSFDFLNTTVTTANILGSGETISIGSSTGTTTINNSFAVTKNVTLNNASTDTCEIKGQVDFTNNDITIRGSTANPMTIGRGAGAVATNTTIGYASLSNNATGARTTAVGSEAALNSDADDNTAIGAAALSTASTGARNTAIGSNAGKDILSGANNTAVGYQSQFTNSTGSANVTIGYRAGYNITGTGNVIIGPADEATVANSATYGAAGNRQLIIGSGPTAWITGDSNYNIALGNSTSTVTVNNDLTVTGDLLVSGDTFTVNVGTLEVEDKNIELGRVSTPTDALADGGGITLRGTSNKSITYVNSVTSWSSSENFNLFTGKSYRINDAVVLSATQVGPSTGTASLGAGVTSSSLTSVGTLTALAVNNTTDVTIAAGLKVDTNTLVVDSTNNRVGILQASPGTTLDVGGNVRLSGSGPEIQLNNGGPRLRVPASNTLTIHTGGDLGTGDSERIRLTTTQLGYGTVNPQEFVHLATSANTTIRVQRTSGITDTINLGKITFYDNAQENCYIQAARDGAAGAGKIQVYTRDILGTVNEHSKFRADGNFEIINGNLVVADGHGIDFSNSGDATAQGVQVTSELLDEYEEGTWTPTDAYGYKYITLAKLLDGADYDPAPNTVGSTTTNITVANPLASGLTVTWTGLDVNGNPEGVRVLNPGNGLYTSGDIVSLDDPTSNVPTTLATYTLVFPKGSYTRIGDMVYATFDIIYPGTSGTPNAGESVQIGGLPFGVAALGIQQAWGGFVTFQEYDGTDSIFLRAVPGGAYFEGTIPNGTALVNSNISQQRLAGTIVYKGD